MIENNGFCIILADILQIHICQRAAYKIECCVFFCHPVEDLWVLLPELVLMCPKAVFLLYVLVIPFSQVCSSPAN